MKYAFALALLLSSQAWAGSGPVKTVHCRIKNLKVDGETPDYYPRKRQFGVNLICIENLKDLFGASIGPHEAQNWLAYNRLTLQLANKAFQNQEIVEFGLDQPAYGIVQTMAGRSVKFQDDISVTPGIGGVQQTLKPGQTLVISSSKLVDLIVQAKVQFKTSSGYIFSAQNGQISISGENGQAALSFLGESLRAPLSHGIKLSNELAEEIIQQLQKSGIQFTENVEVAHGHKEENLSLVSGKSMSEYCVRTTQLKTGTTTSACFLNPDLKEIF